MSPLEKQEYIHFKGQRCSNLGIHQKKHLYCVMTYTKDLSSYNQALKNTQKTTNKLACQSHLYVQHIKVFTFYKLIPRPTGETGIVRSHNFSSLVWPRRLFFCSPTFTVVKEP